MDFVHLHTHSQFSFHAGVPSVRELVARAKELGMRAVALTDTDRMSGLIRHYEECRQVGLKPLLGVELTDPKGRSAMTGGEGASRIDGAGVAGCERLVLIARNARGYAELCDITTRRHLDGERFSFETAFAEAWENVIIITAWPRLLALIADGPNRGRLYAELVSNSATTRQRSTALAALAARLELPLVATNDSFFLDSAEFDTHRILTAIGLNASVSRLEPGELASPQATLRSAAEMERAFATHTGAGCHEAERAALQNTARIADECDVELELGKWILPQVSVPSSYTPESYLAELSWRGLESHYSRAPARTYDRARQLQAMELDVVAKLGYASYFLMVKEIRDWGNERFRSRFRQPQDCTILRGSAANSITFYNIGVSDLDPIRYDLYFQRFLNEDRASPPDADLDFGWDEREEVFGFMSERWGVDCVAVTCTTNHFRERAAFRETAKAFGYTEEQITHILASRKTRTKQIDDEEIRRLWDLAGTIRGKPRFLGQHPGGVLITNDPIRRHVACEYSGGDKNRIVTQIDMHNGIDELGLIKFDILGNGSLSVLRDALSQLEESDVDDPGVWDLEKCYADERVKDLIRTGRTKGIFYIESPAQRRLNQKAQAETFEEITITSSLVRPAGTAYAQTFVERERQRGIVDWTFVHPSVEGILRDTHDVCAFQEDVTKICHQVAGLSFKQADKIRKMMNSHHEGAPDEDVWRETARAFLDGCREHSGLTGEQALELWKRVSSFTGFSFCKSHSATYAQLSFQCTYLKAYYPAQFLAAVISNGHGFYRKDVYLNEARRWGIRVLPIDINESAVRFRGHDRLMRPGMMHVRGVRAVCLEEIVAERRDGGAYRDLPDFVSRLDGIRRSEVESLIRVGAFDRLGLTQPESLYLLDDLLSPGSHEVGATGDLFSEDNQPQDVRQLVPGGLHNYNLAERCLNELALLGYMLSGDILEILQLHPGANGAVAARDVHHHVGQRIKLFGKEVTERMHRVASSGEPMMFLTIEDKTESVDVVLWPDIFERFADVLAGPGPFEIWGTVSEDFGTFTVEADAVRSVEWSPNLVDLELASKHLAQSFGPEFTYADLKEVAAA